MASILLLLPPTGEHFVYFVNAALDMNVAVYGASDHSFTPEPLVGIQMVLSLPYDEPELAAEQAVAALEQKVDAVLAIDDRGVDLAARLNEKLKLPGNTLAALRTMRDRVAFRQMQKAYAFNCPSLHTTASEREALALAPVLPYPVVVSMRRLCGGHGVIRADDPDSYAQAVTRVGRIQKSFGRDAPAPGFVVESFVPGTEHALEGFLQDTALRVLAVFDKPAPTTDPYFSASIYVSPSKLPAHVQATVAADVQRACALLGLTTGPVHVTFRVNESGPWLLEIAPCSFGEMCARGLKYRLGMTLEELILRSALRLPLPITPDDESAGIMMIPIPEQGTFRGVTGLPAARAVLGIANVHVAARPGQIVAPPPESADCLGFIFCRATTPDAAEGALRTAYSKLGYEIEKEAPVTSP